MLGMSVISPNTSALAKFNRAKQDVRKSVYKVLILYQ
jgi:hypothetical protein